MITKGNQKEKVKTNLANIIEKAVQMRQEKIFYNVDFKFMLEGNIKLVFDISDSKSAQIKLKIYETNEQQSTRVAKNFFSDFGISESLSENTQHVQEQARRHEENETTFFPEFPLDRLVFPTELKISYTSYLLDSDNKAEMKEASHMLKENTQTFINADQLKKWITTEEMTVKKLIIGFSVHKKCKNNCLGQSAANIGVNCPDTCQKRMKKTLNENQRRTILYSMIYLDNAENRTIHPDVRTLFWMRASGAAQYMDTYSDYLSTDSGKKYSYYEALKEFQPLPPSPSVSLIYADQKRLEFDLKTPKRKKAYQKMLNFITPETMQNMFVDIMLNYTKRNASFLYN